MKYVNFSLCVKNDSDSITPGKKQKSEKHFFVYDWSVLRKIVVIAWPHANAVLF